MTSCKLLPSLLTGPTALYENQPSAEIRVKKTEDFLRLLICASDPLRRFVWSRSKNCGLLTISDLCERPSAEIRVVEVKKPTLCGDSCGRGQKTEDFLYDF